MSTDCLLVGFFDPPFEEYVQMVRSMGLQSGAYRDLRLAFVEHEGKPLRALELLTRLRQESGLAEPRFHNADFLWPVILYLGTYLHRHGLTWDYVNLVHLEKEKFRALVASGAVTAVAITTTVYVSPRPILEIVAFIRQLSRDVKIIIGGPYVLSQVLAADEDAVMRLFKYIGADFYVISAEGEYALVQILRALKEGGRYDTIANIAYRCGDRYAVTGSCAEENPLEQNSIDYSLFPNNVYGRVVSVRTSKSCPFACAYCGFHVRGGRYTYLGVEEMERELDALANVGTIRYLSFIDDTLNVPASRFKAMLKMMIRNRYGFKWHANYRCGTQDAEVAALMAEAGCEGVFLGVESGSDDMLVRMRKGIRRDDCVRTISLLKQAGLHTHVNVIVGFPGETRESFQRTTELIEETGPDTYRAQLWYADPVTPIWRQREEYGIQGSMFSWTHKTMRWDEAAALVEDMFRSIRHSTWLPQYGFELWSIFYLQARGLAKEQVMLFLRSFNAAVGERLMAPGRSSISPAILAQMRRACCPDRKDGSSHGLEEERSVGLGVARDDEQTFEFS